MEASYRLGTIAEETYQHLELKDLLPLEQKGSHKNSRETKDQLLIDKMIIQNCKRRLTGLGMAWIDFKKALDMVSHSCIIKCMTMFGAAENVTKLLQSRIERWKTELTTGGKILCKVNIRRRIFQGDRLSPLLFIISLVPLTLELRKTKAGYDLAQRRGVINHLLYVDHLKVYGKKRVRARYTRSSRR